jgi:glycyl-tRNA synthetase
LPETKHKIDIDVLASLAKRRGFIFQSSEIYGGLGSTWDYGPLGVELKRNVKELWWRRFVLGRDDMVGLDSAVLMHPKVWEASGHVSSFSDPLVECKNCHHRFREDHLDGEVCPDCGGELMEARQFNLMFKTFLGPVEETASATYLRPETAQGIFVNFENVMTTTRRKPPFGIAQVGKAFRNEITTGNFIFRTREFEMMEIEFFVPPGTDDDWHTKWVEETRQWYVSLGIDESALRIREHEGKELAHYAKATHDLEYQFPWGWGEMAGVANRTDYDLKAHTSATGRDLSYFVEESKEHIVPYVIEPSFGVDRAVMALLVDAYSEDEVTDSKGKTETRVVLKLHPSVAPIKVAVLPLSKKEPVASRAKEVVAQIRDSGAIQGVIQYDDTQSIGRRYRRQDEVGTPLCVTVDFDSLDDAKVTIRDRDSMEQVRVPIAGLEAELASRLGA